MTRHIIPFFNPSRPVFVKVENFQAGGKVWKKGERFNWEFINVPHETMQILFNQDYLHHNEEFEEEVVKRISVGDGLEELSLDQLHVLVEAINGKVKAKTNTNRDFLHKKCATSKVKDKQIGLIRRWRSAYGDMEN